ncbi:MAG: C25 family cysteine peptidase [Bacteroidales bacterium]|nr:C25 family cysteine peptidase [Bacteroidales bacterium]
MKKIYKSYSFFIVSIIFILFSIGAEAQRTELKFQSPTVKEGFQIQRSDAASFRFSHGIPEMAIDDFDANGYMGQVIELNSIYLPANAGAPNLPSSSRFIAVPNGAKPRLVIKSSKKQVIQNIDLLPAAPIPLGNDDEPLKYDKDLTIYTKNAFFPAEPFQISEVTNLRGVEAVTIGITPFQYNPVTKELIVYYDIDAEIVFEGGKGSFGDDRLRSQWWDVILEDNILNSNVLPKVDYAARTRDFANNREEGCEYLIIIPNNPVFAQWADSIRVFRQRQGILTKIVSLTEVGGNTVNALEAYVNNAYNTWTMPPSAILLLGDFSTNAADGIISHTLNDHPGGYNPYISDHPFADVSGNNLPDIVFARITARNAAELQHMINKFLNYERTPPTSASFYNNPITAMGWQTERWFQLCSETVNGFWEHALGKNPVRQNAIYSGTPGGAWSSNANTSTVVNYFGPNGLNYIPANTAHLTDWGGNATRVNNSINSGAFMLQHRDHGMETGWGEPSYTNNHMGGLTNQDLTFVWSINCLTGKFNYSSESFTEKFHRHNFGALGLIAATEVSYSFVNDAFVWGAYDNMWPQFMPDYGTTPAERGILPGFANAAGKYFLQQSNWPYNTEHKAITHKLFHHHGDAFMTVYSEIPQLLTVSHMPVLLSGLDIFEVTANAGALVAITVNDEIIGSAIANGSSVQVPIVSQLPGAQVRITVTLQNYYRYEQIIDCIPPDGPYMIYNSYVVNDATGNNNGFVDYGENITLDLIMKNVGSDQAENVTVTATSVSPDITFTNATFDLGSVAANSTVTSVNALEFNVSASIPDKTNIPVQLNISSATEQWTSQFLIPVKAPDFTVGTFTIADPLGNNNNRLDPGETVEITFTASNTGQSDVSDVTGTFLSNSPFLTVSSPVQQLGAISAGQQVAVSFTAQVSGGAPIGSVANFGFKIQSGAYDDEKTFNAKIGLITEDFETGNFNQFTWTNGGNQPWQITNIEPYSGVYAAKSGTISHNQTSQLLLQYDVGVADTISFYYKVSSEANYDYLRFYINNVQIAQWAGTVNWTKASFPVSAGMKTFKWEYMKDGSVSSGQDCAWVDDIVFPPIITTMAWAGADMMLCPGSNAQLNGTASNYTSLLWTTNGTGSFNNATIINPVYTPSEADQQAGSVILTLTATGTGTVTDNLVLGFYAPITADAGEDIATCASSQEVLIHGATVSTTSLIEWFTSGDGTFTAPNSLQTTYLPGLQDVTSGAVTLRFFAKDAGECFAASDSLMVEFIPMPEVFAGNNTTICSGNTLLLSEATANNHLSVVWTSSGDGSFENQATLEALYIPGESDVEAGEVELTLTAQGIGDCEDVVSSLILNFYSAPSADAGEDLSVCSGGNLTFIEDAKAAFFTCLIWTTSGDGVFSDPISLQTAYTTGPADDLNGQVTLYLTVHGLGECANAIDSLLINIHPLPTISLGNDQTVCFGQEATVEMTLTGVSPWTVVMAEPDSTHVIESSGFTMTMTPQATMQLAVVSVSDAHCSVQTNQNIWLHVVHTPLQPLAPAGPDSVDFANGLSSTFNLTEVEYAESYNFSLQPENAGSVTVSDMEATISWNIDFRGQALIKGQAVNMCGLSEWSSAKEVAVKSTIGIPELGNQSIQLYPNPTNGLFTLEIKGFESSKLNIQITDLLGRKVFAETINNESGSILRQISMEGNENGIYLLTIDNGQTKVVKKLILK